MRAFVYGGTGLVGSGVIDGLLADGHQVLAGSRNPERSPARDGLSWVTADASQPRQGTESLNQAEALFLLSPPGYTDQYSVLAPWIDAAKAADVRKIVLMSAMGVEHLPPEVPFRKLELELMDSGVDYSIIRPNWFMQNFATFWLQGILDDGKIYFPAGDAQTSFIDARDIAAVTTRLLIDQNRKNTEFLLTGGEGLTHGEVAEILSTTTRSKIEYANISPEQFRDGLLKAGLPEDYADFLVTIAGALRDGHAAEISPAVGEILGHAPTRFTEYATGAREAWLQTA